MPTGRYELLFSESPVVRLLKRRTGAFLCDFLYEAFKAEDCVTVSEEVLESKLEDRIEEFREAEVTDGGESSEVSKSARDYLKDWCSEEFRLLRREFSSSNNEYVYKLTRHAEKALGTLEEWLSGESRGYATAKSRFTSILEGLQNLASDANPDPEVRIDELVERRKELDREIQSIRTTGIVQSLEPGEVKDRLHDLSRAIGEFLADFRAIEDNFKEQARNVRKKFSEGGIAKGDVLEQALDAEEDLRLCDQGRSYFGFSEMMARSKERETLRECSSEAAKLAHEEGLDPKVFTGLAGRLIEEEGVVQGAYGQISRQLKRVVEDFHAGEAQRVKELLSGIRKLAMKAAEDPPTDSDWPVEVTLPPKIGNFMELRFFEHRQTVEFSDIEPESEEDLDHARSTLLTLGKPLNLGEYRKQVKEALKSKPQVSLRELLEIHPPDDGVVGLLAYHAVAGEEDTHIIDDSKLERHDLGEGRQPRFVEGPTILFQKK